MNTNSQDEKNRTIHLAKPRLAIFIPSMHDGGAERTIVNLSRGIVELGYPLDLVLAKAEGPHLENIPDTARLVDLQADRVLTSLPALMRYLRRERPQALLSVLNHANIVALWSKRLTGVSTRVIVCEQNTLSVSARNGLTHRAKLMPWLVKLFYPWACGIIAVSGGVADDLAQVIGIPREQVQVIYNPVVTPELRQKAKANLDHPWFKPGQPPVILGIGRLREQKDFSTLIHAFDQVRRTCPARLLILGEGPERPALETLVKQLDLEQDVSLPGFIKNPYPYMSQAALFVLSSRWEGLPTVLIEALSCGVPVVSTDCPSGPREILAGGKYGKLVPVQDQSALAYAIGQALKGNTPHPSQESWLPYEITTVVEKYLHLLVNNQYA